MTLDPAAIVELFRLRGDLPYGEAVSQTSHALQCAQRAAEDGADAPLIAAALLHDIGHLFNPEPPAPGPDRDDRHEQIGADRLAAVFGPQVARPVALHVAAKRYLCGRDRAYLEGLSPASRDSLRLQGGPFDAAACARFERVEGWRDALRLRRWDDEGKSTAPPDARFADYLPLLERLARRT